MAVCFPLELIFLKKKHIQEFTSLMKHPFVVWNPESAVLNGPLIKQYPNNVEKYHVIIIP